MGRAVMGWVALCLLAAGPIRADEVISLEVSLKGDGPVISPLLFGHNLEHTRYSVWRGLSAQMLANRKFAAAVTADFDGPKTKIRNAPGADGVAANWYGIGKPAATFQLDTTKAFAGGTSQAITMQEPGQAGIGQAGIVLAEKAYELHAWIQTDRELVVTSRIMGRAGTEITATSKFAPGDWREWTLNFQADRLEAEARWELTFEGPGTLWIGAASLLPADHFNGMRRDVVDLLKEISVPILRWPGGNFTRDYRWKDGLLPVDQRPPTAIHWHETQPFAGNIDDHEIGIDEFMALCRHLGAEPHLMLNLDPKIAPPEDAADWVEYCNGPPDRGWGKVRAERGHSNPYRVKYWSVGNEIWGFWMGPVHSDPKAYATKLAQYATALRKADPSLVLVASGLPGDWDKALLPLVASQIDLISEHDYAAEEQAHAASPAPEELARLLKLPETRVVGMLRATRELADVSSKAKTIGIAFDEWNVWHNWFTRPMENTWRVGPIDGLYAATLLNVLCREHQALGVTMANYFEPINEGAIAVEPTTARLTPVGQVFSLYRAHHGNRLLATTAQGDAKAVDICASAPVGGHEVVLTLVNHDPTRARSVEIRVPGASRLDQATARVLSASDLTPDRAFDDHQEPLHGEEGRLSLTLPRYSTVLVRVNIQ